MTNGDRREVIQKYTYTSQNGYGDGRYGNSGPEYPGSDGYKDPRGPGSTSSRDSTSGPGRYVNSLYSLFEHDIISNHLMPSWLILQVTFAVYSKIVVSVLLFHCLFKHIIDVNLTSYGSIGSEIRNKCFVVAMHLENQPRWLQMQTINLLLFSAFEILEI